MKIRCNCKCENQDKLHGNNIRIANKTSKPEMYRCTGCGKDVKATAKA